MVYHNPLSGRKNTMLHNSANYVNKCNISTSGCGRTLSGNGIFGREVYIKNRTIMAIKLRKTVKKEQKLDFLEENVIIMLQPLF